MARLRKLLRGRPQQLMFAAKDRQKNGDGCA